MQKYQYFGPPYNVQLDNRSVHLRPSALIDLADDEASTVSAMAGARLAPVPKPKRVTPSPIAPEPTPDLPQPEEKVTEGNNAGILLEDVPDEVKTDKPYETKKAKTKGKKKKSKKEEGQDNAPSADNEG